MIVRPARLSRVRLEDRLCSSASGRLQLRTQLGKYTMATSCYPVLLHITSLYTPATILSALETDREHVK
jgi:hypothetical protein